MSFNLDNRRLDVFGTSVISRRHRVLCHLGFTFHYFRRRRSSRNRGSLVSNTTSGGDTPLRVVIPFKSSLRIRHSLQLAVEESELDEPELGKAGFDKPESGLDKPEPRLDKSVLGYD
ncbi:hypothetical protein Tco_0780530 [Tanacetum coccineum]